MVADFTRRRHHLRTTAVVHGLSKLSRSWQARVAPPDGLSKRSSANRNSPNRTVITRVRWGSIRAGHRWELTCLRGLGSPLFCWRNPRNTRYTVPPIHIHRSPATGMHTWTGQMVRGDWQPFVASPCRHFCGTSSRSCEPSPTEPRRKSRSCRGWSCFSPAILS